MPMKLMMKGGCGIH